MTVICAMRHPSGEVALAADSRTTSNDCILSNHRRKILRCNGVAFAVAGPGHLLMSIESELMRGWSPESVPEVVERIMDTIRGQGWKPMDQDGEPPRYGFSGCLIDASGAYYLGGDGAYVNVGTAFPATAGSGGQEAAGAALALVESAEGWMEWTAAEVCRRACEITSRLDSACGGEIHVEVA